MTARPYTRADYLAIKSAFRRACEDAGPLATIAEYTRVDPALLSRYGNPDRPEFPPVDVMMDVDALSGGDRCLRALAEIRGYELVREERGVAIENPIQHAGCVGKEAGEALVAISEVVRKPTPLNAARAERELQDLKDVTDLAEADMRRIRAGGAS